MVNEEAAKKYEPSLVDEGVGTTYKNKRDIDTMKVDEKHEMSSSSTLDFHQALSTWKRDRGSAMWQHALSHVQFDEALLLQHLERIETQHRQRSESAVEDSANTTGCNIPEVEKDALQMDKVAEVDNPAGAFVEEADSFVQTWHKVSGAALAFAGGCTFTPLGKGYHAAAGGVHGLLGTAWGIANPSVSKNTVRDECTSMLNSQGEKMVALVNTKMVQVSRCVNELRGQVNKLFSGLIHFNLLSDEGKVQRGYAGIMMQLDGGSRDMNLIANAIDRNLGHCGAINNYQRWMQREPGAKAELQKLLPVAQAWMKVCEKLSLMFVAMLRENIPFAETYIETVNLDVANGFVTYMEAVTQHQNAIKSYVDAAKNYRNLVLLIKAHRVNGFSKKAFPARQPRLGRKWSSKNGPFCRKQGTNTAERFSTTNWGTWETRDSFRNCVNNGGWYSKSRSRVDLYDKSLIDARRRRSYVRRRRSGPRRRFQGYGGPHGRLLETDSGTKGSPKEEKHSSVDEDKFGKLKRNSAPTE